MVELSIFVQQVIVVVCSLLGIITGEIVASFFFGRIKSGITQLIQLVLFATFIVLEGYILQFMGIPLFSLGLFQAIIVAFLFGFIIVFVNRTILYSGGWVLSKIRVKKRKSLGINGGDLVNYLEGKGVKMVDIEEILIKSSTSKKKAVNLVQSGEWIKVEPRTLCYELSKHGLPVDDIIEILTEIVGLSPEEAARTWREFSV